MWPRAQDYSFRIANICFRLAHRTHTRFFHWLGNVWLFVLSQGRFPNRRNPNTIDLAFFNKNDTEGIALSAFTDKELVKHFVRSMAPEVRVPETYGILRTVEELRSLNLGRPYVAKPTHSSGVVVLKPEGGALTEKEVEDLVERLEKNYYLGGGEIQYRFLERKIIVEEFIGHGGIVAPDFKFECYLGWIQHCYVVLDRFGDAKPFFLDRNGNLVAVSYRSPLYDPKLTLLEGPVELPSEWERMKAVAERLSEPFKFVRVDLLPHDGEILFGELTFTPGNCLFSYEPEDFMTLVPPETPLRGRG